MMMKYTYFFQDPTTGHVSERTCEHDIDVSRHRHLMGLYWTAPKVAVSAFLDQMGKRKHAVIDRARAATSHRYNEPTSRQCAVAVAAATKEFRDMIRPRFGSVDEAELTDAIAESVHGSLT